MVTLFNKILKKYDNIFVFSFISAIIVSYVVHFTYFSNIIYNWDCMLNGPERLGVGIGEGRFLVTLYLDVLKVLGMGTQINYFNAIVGILFMALSISYIIYIFKIQSKIIAAFIVLVFICFPSITSLNFHYYCINVYSFSCFLSVLGAYYILQEKLIKKIIGSLLVAFSIGGYQAYVGITLSIFLINYIILSLTTKEKIKIKRFIIDGIFILLSFVFYKILLSLFEYIYNTKASYPLDLSTLFIGIIDCYKITFTLAFKNYGGLVSYINSTTVLKIAYGLALLSAIIHIFIIIINFKSKPFFNLLFTLGLIILMPMAMFFIHIVSDRIPDALMMQSYTFFFIFPLVLHYYIYDTSNIIEKNDNSGGGVFGAILGIVIVIITLQYSYLNAYNYHALFEENRLADIKYNQLITRIESCEGYYVNIPIAFIGNYVPVKYNMNPYSDDRTWFRGGYLISNSAVENWIRPYYLSKIMDFNYLPADNKIIESIKKMSEFEDMGLYPDANSIKVIDNTLVVKLPNTINEMYRN